MKIRRLFIAIGMVGLFAVGCSGREADTPPSSTPSAAPPAAPKQTLSEAEKKPVVEVIEEMQTAWASKDMDRLMALISERFVSADGNKAQLRTTFAEEQMFKVFEWNTDGMDISLTDDEAHVDLVMEHLPSGVLFPVQMVLEKEGDKWLITGSAMTDTASAAPQF